MDLSLALRIGAIGDRPDDPDDEKLRHRFLIYMGLLMSAGGLVWGSMAASLGLLWPAIIPYGYAVITAVNMLWFWRSKHFPSVQTIQVLISLLLPFLFQWSLGGFVASGGVMLWAMLAMVGSLTFSEARRSVQWLVVYVLLTVVSGAVDQHLGAWAVKPPPGLSSFFFALNISVISSIVFGLSIWMSAQRANALVALESANTQVSQMNEALEAQVRERTQALAAELARSRAVVDNSGDGLVALDRAGTLQVVNPALRSVLGIDVREGAKAFDAMPDTLTSAAARAMEQGEVIREQVSLGSDRTGGVVASPILLDRTDPATCVGAVLIVRDITLETHIDAMKTNFIATVSHELRTPLTSILGFAKTTRSRLDSKVFPFVPAEDARAVRARDQAAGNLDIIVSEGERLAALIGDLLDISKMESGQMEWHFAPEAPDEVVRRAAAATASLFSGGPVKLVLDVPAGLPRIHADAMRVQQVLINLISNARKFTDLGTVTIRCREVADGVEFAVHDQGIGIAPGDHEMIFERFKQVGDALTDRPRGTGLGLPICREIVQAHGGSIGVSSRLGQGSTFNVVLPRAT